MTRRRARTNFEPLTPVAWYSWHSRAERRYPHNPPLNKDDQSHPSTDKVGALAKSIAELLPSGVATDVVP